MNDIHRIDSCLYIAVTSAVKMQLNENTRDLPNILKPIGKESGQKGCKPVSYDVS